MTLKRTKPMKRSAPKRDWSEAIDKRAEEGCCRVCGRAGGITVDGEILTLECAHTIDRERQDEIVVGPRGGESRVVRRESTVPLCGDCHRLYDEYRLDLLPHLTIEEQRDAMEAAGGIANANRRLSGAR